MDAAVVETINRLDAARIAKHLDLTDWLNGIVGSGAPWFRRIEADAFFSATVGSGELAWLLGALAAGVPGLHFDGEPADADWDGLFSHFRAEIQDRRDRKSHTETGCVPVAGVV